MIFNLLAKIVSSGYPVARSLPSRVFIIYYFIIGYPGVWRKIFCDNEAACNERSIREKIFFMS